MKQLIRVFCCLALASMLTACGIGNDLPLLTIKPAQLGPARSVQQRLTLSWQDKTHVLESVLEMDDQTLDVVGLAMGLRVYSFRYDGQTLTAGHSHLPAGLSEAIILNDLLLIHAPLDALRQALPQGWQAEESTAHAGLRQRKITREGETALSIQYDAGAPWQGRSVLTQHRHDYQLILDSASEP